MRVFDTDEVEELFPIGPLLSEWCRAEARLDPVRGAVGSDACLLHVVQVFVARDRAATQAAVGDRIQQGLFAAGFNACLDQITHARTYTRSRRDALTPPVCRRGKAEGHPAGFPL